MGVPVCNFCGFCGNCAEYKGAERHKLRRKKFFAEKIPPETEYILRDYKKADK